MQTNNAYFVTKNLRRANILKIKFRNRILTEKTEECKNIHNKHTNLCRSLICKTKRNLYTKLHKNCFLIKKNFGKEYRKFSIKNLSY